MAIDSGRLKNTGIQDVFTVSELTLAVKGTIESAFPGTIFLEGELSNVKVAKPSGHAYLTLKEGLVDHHQKWISWNWHPAIGKIGEWAMSGKDRHMIK